MRITTKLFYVLGIATLASFLSTGQALAHAKLLSSVPAKESIVEGAPHDIELDFSEGVEAAFSSASITGPANSKVSINSLKTSDDKTKLYIPLSEKLISGQYKVEWHVLSVDGHKTHGSYSFSIK